ncbi:protein of unknown function [Sinosporangium album]|uniref:PQQ-like domain-containing protein n=1 Tax=Sinosporangium album TaxID=504805 RepID=A0A1G7UBV3_9ACTN|nr:hypothetical protein [Sinosporangium album]SDG44240.1 protein of unknown function [Sinosporangium album]
MLAQFITVLATTTALLPPGTAAANTAGPAKTDLTKIVSTDPVNHTPHVLDGIVNAFAIVGRTAIVGGSFSEVSEADGSEEFERSHLFAFDLVTGRVLPDFAPDLDGPVYALAAGADGTVYAGGTFSYVGHREVGGLAKFRLSDGAFDTRFAPLVAGGGVSALALRGSHLYVGGDFTHVGRSVRTAVARVDTTTGAADPRFTVTPAKPVKGKVRIYGMALSDRRLAVAGAFTTLDGLSRPQLGLIDITGAQAKVADWRTPTFAVACKADFPSYVRGVDFSSDGKYFVIVTTGGAGGPRKPCDAATRFETFAKGDRIQPTWMNHTGGDSLYSVAVTSAAIYVGGHQRWHNNPHGSDSAGAGAVKREGIAALHPRTGKALAWNPGRERGIGVKAFLPHRGGLLVGSDTTRLGREYHARVGMFPLP